MKGHTRKYPVVLALTLNPLNIGDEEDSLYIKGEIYSDPNILPKIAIKWLTLSTNHSFEDIVGGFFKLYSGLINFDELIEEVEEYGQDLDAVVTREDVYSLILELIGPTAWVECDQFGVVSE